MAVIIRLQNLPWSANAMDVRHFFRGLSIPDGGVHIVGGEKGDAFIAFGTDEDARQAMSLSGERLNNVAVKLLLSSKAEMQKVIQDARGMSSGGGGGPSPGAAFGVPVAGTMGQGYGSSFPAQGGQFMDSRMGDRGDVMPMDMYRQDMSGIGEGPSWGGQPLRNQQVPFGDGGMQARNGFDNNSMMGKSGFRGRADEYPPTNYGGQFDDRMSPAMTPMDQSSRKRSYDDMSRSSCVFVTGMPVTLSYKEIRRMFKGLEIPRDGLKILNNNRGERIGEAYVRFMNPDTAFKALSFKGWQMNGQTVNVFPCSDLEFEDAVDSYVPKSSAPAPREYMPTEPMPPQTKRFRSRSPRRKDTKCVVVKNLPFESDKRDLFKFFSKQRFAQGDLSVHLETRKDGRPSGTAVIEFSTERDFSAGLELFGQVVRGRRVEIHPIPHEEYAARAEAALDTVLQNNAAKQADRSRRDSNRKKSEEKPHDNKSATSATSSTPNVSSVTVNEALPKQDADSRKDVKDSGLKKDASCYCVRLYGLPFSCTYAMVEDFFKGLQIARKGIHFITLDNGKVAPTGFVEFVTSQDCKKALEKHKAYMENRYIEIKEITKKEMLDEIDSQRTLSRNKKNAGSARNQNEWTVGMSNLFFGATLEDIMGFFGQFKPIANSVKMRYVDGKPTGDAVISFRFKDQATAAIESLNRRNFLGRTVSLFLA